ESPPHVHRQRHTQQPAPVLANQRDIPQVQPLNEPPQHPAVKRKRVDRLVYRFTRPPKADKIRRDGAMSRRRKYRNHFPIEIAPRWFAVQAKKYLLGVGRSFIQIMNTDSFVSRQILNIVRSKSKPWQTCKTLFRRPQDFHLCPLTIGIFP